MKFNSLEELCVDRQRNHDSRLEGSNFIQTIEKRQGLKNACLEEIAYNKVYIIIGLGRLGNHYSMNEHGDYLRKLVKN